MLDCWLGNIQFGANIPPSYVHSPLVLGRRIQDNIVILLHNYASKDRHIWFDIGRNKTLYIPDL
jgi:hypothetical protein